MAWTGGCWKFRVRPLRAASVAVAALLGAAPAPAGVPVELELVLAVDASSSVDDREFELQMQGIAAAFRHSGVQAAIHGTGEKGIAVVLMTWSSTS